jgi:hypothetical protein
MSDAWAETAMGDIAERLREELSDAVNRICGMGGGLVFEEFPGALEQHSPPADQMDPSRVGEAPDTSAVARRLLIDAANALAEALTRLRRPEHQAHRLQAGNAFDAR